MSSLHSDIVGSLPRLYDAALSSDRWIAALDTIGDLVQAKGVMLYAVGHDEAPYSVNRANSFYADKAELIAEYTERFMDYDVFGMQSVDSWPALTPIADTDIWPGYETLMQREDFVWTRDVAGFSRRIYFNLNDVKLLFSGLILQFDSALEEAPRASIDRASILVPHLARTLEINRFYAPLRQRYNAVLAVLDRVQIGVSVATEAGELILVNQTARQILEGGFGLWQDRRGRLVATEPETTAQIEQAITACAGTAAGTSDNSGFEIAVPRAHLDPLLVVIAPLRDSGSELERDYTGCLVTIIDPTHKTEVRIDILQKVYGLTVAEAEVAARLVQGAPVEEIAESRNVGLATIRAQIKSLYAKTDVSSRHAFMWKAIQLLPPIS